VWQENETNSFFYSVIELDMWIIPGEATPDAVSPGLSPGHGGPDSPGFFTCKRQDKE